MIIATFLYPATPYARFDAAYFVAKHVPMALRLLGNAVKGAVVESGLGGGQVDSAPPFVAALHMLFESVDSFRDAFRTHADAIQGDVANYTDIKPLVQIGYVHAVTMGAAMSVP